MLISSFPSTLEPCKTSTFERWQKAPQCHIRLIEEILASNQDVFAPWKNAFGRASDRYKEVGIPFPEDRSPKNIHFFLEKYLQSLLSPRKDRENVVQWPGEKAYYLNTCRQKLLRLVLKDMSEASHSLRRSDTLKKIPAAIKSLQVLARANGGLGKKLDVSRYSTLDRLINAHAHPVCARKKIKTEPAPNWPEEAGHPFHPRRFSPTQGDGLYFTTTGETYEVHHGRISRTVRPTKFADLQKTP